MRFEEAANSKLFEIDKQKQDSPLKDFGNSYAIPCYGRIVPSVLTPSHP